MYGKSSCELLWFGSLVSGFDLETEAAITDNHENVTSTGTPGREDLYWQVSVCRKPANMARLGSKHKAKDQIS